jgi:hypothetical protein
MKLRKLKMCKLWLNYDCWASTHLCVGIFMHLHVYTKVGATAAFVKNTA